MTKILIVDDNPVDRQLVGRLLEKFAEAVEDPCDASLTPIFADNGRDALDVIAREHPELVLTDLQMPFVDGLELVQSIREDHPLVPVVLMTAHGSEDIATQALRSGAANYVPKKHLARDLIDVISSVLASSRAKRGQRRLMECLTSTESQYVLENDASLIPSLVGQLKGNLAEITRCDETTLIRVSVALREALLNAMEHGNLELDSALRESGGAEYHRLAAERRQSSPYRDRRVYVVARETPTEAVYTIRDEGPGFDPNSLPDPLDPENLEKASGRGLLLIRTFMTRVNYLGRGNVCVMEKETSQPAK